MKRIQNTSFLKTFKERIHKRNTNRGIEFREMGEKINANCDTDPKLGPFWAPKSKVIPFLKAIEIL